MNRLRFSGSPSRATCSAETIVPCTISTSTPAASRSGVSSSACCGLTRAATVTPESLIRLTAWASSSGRIGAACSCCSSRIGTSGSSVSSAARTTSASRCSTSACRAHRPSALSTPSPPSSPMRTAVAGDTTASVGCVTSGMSNRYASICQDSETSLDERVRRDGTISMSSRS